MTVLPPGASLNTSQSTTPDVRKQLVSNLEGEVKKWKKEVKRE